MIREAVPTDAGALTGIAFRSKAHWGYSTADMQAFRAELLITPEYLDVNPAFVLVLRGLLDQAGSEVVEDAKPIGFCTLERLSATEVELGHLFIEPGEMGRGLGRLLIAHACEEARRRRYAVLVIQSDPNAEQFYLTCGARRVGSKDSLSIPGRPLPLLELDLGLAS